MHAALNAVDRNPTEAQKAAGNYAKGHVKALGFDITIENPRGAMRRGVGGNGKPWSVRMPAHYGYIKRTEGADGDHVDVYLGPHLKSPNVFVVDQVDAETGKFDEHKVMLGFATYQQARNAYIRGFSDGKGEKRIGAMSEMGLDQFRNWINDGQTDKPMTAVPKRAVGGRVEYADGGALPDAPWAAKDTLPDAPWAAAAPAKPASSHNSSWAAPITDVPSEVYKAGAESLSATNDYLNPFSEAHTKGRAELAKKPWYAEYTETGPGTFLGTGKGLLAAASVPFSPITGAARSLIGHPLSWAMPTTTPAKQEAARKAGIAESAIPGTSLEENYERAKGDTDTALMGMAPRGASPVGPRTVPLPRQPGQGPLGVTLSEGQETGALPLIQREQAALRGQAGDASQARAREFADQQHAEVQAAGESVARQLDPYRQVVAETPQEAGQLVSEGVQSAAGQAKAGVTQAYETAKNLPGEIHAGAFEGIGQKIKGDLSLGDNPIIIDDKLTPFASRAIRDVEDRISKLRIQNRADPFGEPNPENIVGVDLRGVDQMRKRLVAFRQDAYASGNAADGRAARGVIDAFDKHIDAAVNGGLFKGDPRAVQAWNDARAAHADYKRTFSAGKDDPTGRVVERILGKNNNPAAIPNDVADFLYGGSGINPSSLNVNVVKRVRSILGDQSPEWSAVKQGLFSRITDPGPGVTDWGPGKIAQRVNKFLNVDGLELSKEVFSPAERALIQQYGQLNRKLEVPQAGANWSNTSTVLGPMLKKISGGVAAVVGAIIGHTIAPGLHGIGEGIGAAASAKVSGAFTQARQLRQLARQMPIVAEATQQYQRALVQQQRLSSPLTQSALTAAAANLGRSLQTIGLDATSVLRPQAQPQAQN